MKKATCQLSVFFLSLCLGATSLAAAANNAESPVILVAAKSSSEEQTLIAQLHSSASIEKRHAPIEIHQFYLHN